LYAKKRGNTVQTQRSQQSPNTVTTPNPGPRSGWQARAIAAYRLEQPDEATLRLRLAAAVHNLTGRAVAPDAILVDLVGRAASARVDGVHFRWADGQLHLIRPCAHCSLGAFASQPLRHVEELGFVLGAWQPLHDDCRPFEADQFY
jgi:hypothetical protein